MDHESRWQVFCIAHVVEKGSFILFAIHKYILGSGFYPDRILRHLVRKNEGRVYY